MRNIKARVLEFSLDINSFSKIWRCLNKCVQESETRYLKSSTVETVKHSWNFNSRFKSIVNLMNILFICNKNHKTNLLGTWTWPALRTLAWTTDEQWATCKYPRVYTQELNFGNISFDFQWTKFLVLFTDWELQLK